MQFSVICFVLYEMIIIHNSGLLLLDCIDYIIIKKDKIE